MAYITYISASCLDEWLSLNLEGTLQSWPSRRTMCVLSRHHFDARFARKPLSSVASKAPLDVAAKAKENINGKRD